MSISTSRIQNIRIEGEGGYYWTERRWRCIPGPNGDNTGNCAREDVQILLEKLHCKLVSSHAAQLKNALATL